MSIMIRYCAKSLVVFLQGFFMYEDSVVETAYIFQSKCNTFLSELVQRVVLLLI